MDKEVLYPFPGSDEPGESVFDGQRFVAETGITGADMTTRGQRAGFARLMLRWPGGRATLLEKGTSDETLLDLCESYDLACNAAVHWSKSDKPRAADIACEYRGLIFELEIEAREMVNVKLRRLGNDIRYPC
ncbi:hypothetical protein [Bosea sp. NPDC055594]